MNENLFRLIRDCWKDDGRFTLAASRLPAGSPGADLVTRHFPSATIELTGASEPKQENEYVIIEKAIAVATFWRHNSVPVKFRFSKSPAGTVHVEMLFINVTERFRFGEHFPSTGKVANWGHLELKEVKLRLDSQLLENKSGAELQKRYAAEQFSEEQEKGVVKGWEISGIPALPEGWDWIYDLLGDRSVFRLQGPLEIFEGIPRFVLATKMYEPVEIGHLKPSFAFEMISWFAEYAMSKKEIILPAFSFRFRSQLIPPVGEPPRPITLFAHWGLTTPTELLFTVDAMLSVQGTLQALDKLFNLQSNQGLSTLLPKENFPVFTSVVLKTIDFSVSLKTLRPKRITICMGLAPDASFVIFPGIMTAKRIDLTGNMIFGSGPKPFMNLSASGAIELTAGSQQVLINSSFQLPALNYSLGLDPATAVNISTLIRDLFPSLGELPAVWASTLTCSGKIKPPALTFESEFETEIEWLYLKLKNFGVSFAARRENNDTKIEAEINVGLVLADRVNVGLIGRVSKEQLFVSGEIVAGERIMLPEILPAGIALPDRFKEWGFDRGSMHLKKGKENEISFTLKGDVGFDFGDAGKMSGQVLSVTVTQKADKNWSVVISVEGEIALFKLSGQKNKNWLVDLKGTIKLNAASLSNWDLSFEAKKGSGTIGPVDLPIPKKIINGKVSFSKVTVQPELVKLTLNGAQWEFEIKSNFKLDTFEFLEELIPETGIDAFIQIRKNAQNEIKASIGIRTAIGLTRRIHLPERQGMTALDLGLTRFELSSATISVSSSLGLEFKASTSWYLPQYLNEMFGVEGKPAEHRPRFRFFKTYKPEGNVVEDALTTDFTIGLNSKGEPSGSVELSNIPLSIIDKSGDSFVLSFGPETDKGKYGQIGFKKPKLGYNAIKGFEIALDFTIIKDPALPLTPMIEFMKRAGLGHLAKALPDPLPLPISDPPRFFVGKKFNWDLLKALFERFGHGGLFEQMKKLLLPIEEQFEQLPVTLKDYLNPPPFKGFALNLKVSPTGNVEAGFEMKQDEGIKPDDPSSKKKSLQLLLVPGIPSVFFGIRLRKFNFGQLFGGQLLTVMFDADVDVFDILSLSAALIRDERIRYYIGKSEEFTRNIQLYDVRMFIIWQTQIPLIIPAFYRKVGIDYYGLGDVRFQSSFGFPEPEFDLSKLGKMLGHLVKFLKDPGAPMPENEDYKPMDLAFSMGPLYLETGKWMGSKVIGWKTPLTPPGGITLSALLARLLNTIKFFSINKFIRNIPYGNRNAEGTLVSGFLGMELGGKFLLSTPFEFINTEWKDWKLTEDQRTNLVSIVSATGGKPVTPDTEGIVLFLRGMWTSKFGSLDTSFGMIALDSKNFAIGFRFDGQLANTISINTAASVTINPPATPFAFAGSSHAELKLAGMVFFKGKINASGNHSRFAFDGELALSEPGQTFNINGNAKVSGYFDQNSFSVSGGAGVSFLIFSGSGSFSVNAVSRTSANGNLEINVPGAFELKTGFSINSDGFRVNAWANLFTFFHTNFIAQLHTPTRTTHFLLESKPLGGLFGFTLDFKATFGNNVNQKGRFFIDLVPNLIPNARIFNGDCTFRSNGHGQTSFYINGRIELLAFITTLEGDFHPHGFLLSGSISVLGLKTTIRISHTGIGFEIQYLGLPPVGASVKACRDTLYICGKVDGRDFYINLKNIADIKFAPCPCGQKRFSECRYPEANALFMLAAYSHHQLFRKGRNKIPASASNKSDLRYDIRVTPVNKTSKLANFRVKRKNQKEDFFTELKRDVLRVTDRTVWNRNISLTDAYLEGIANWKQMVSGTIELKMYFPESPNPDCRLITAKISYGNPKLAGTELARALKALDRRRLKDSKKKIKSPKSTTGKMPAKKPKKLLSKAKEKSGVRKPGKEKKARVLSVKKGKTDKGKIKPLKKRGTGKNVRRKK